MDLPEVPAGWLVTIGVAIAGWAWKVSHNLGTIAQSVKHGAETTKHHGRRLDEHGHKIARLETTAEHHDKRFEHLERRRDDDDG